LILIGGRRENLLWHYGKTQANAAASIDHETQHIRESKYDELALRELSSYLKFHIVFWEKKFSSRK
jgi:hypothetical protein